MSWPKDRVFKSGDEFVAWLKKNYPNTMKNNISETHTHHTWSPNHSNNQSTLRLHQNMRNYHMNTRGWGDIAQHVSIGKTGEVVLGRSITLKPISASYHNGTSSWHPFMFETIGNFDVGHDKLEGNQLASVLAILHLFNVELKKPNKLHRSMSSKTCPGSSISHAKLAAQAKAYKPGEAVGDVTDTSARPHPTVPVVSNSNSIRDYLVSTGQDGSFENRAKLAAKHGIKGYKGTASQNLQLLSILRSETGKNKKKSSATIAQEVSDGKWGVNPQRKRDLESAGYNYTEVQGIVNRIIGGQQTKPKPVTKSIDQLAKEVIDGKHGQGDARKKSLGSQYSAVQARVNAILDGGKPQRKTVDQMAREVIAGKHGQGHANRQKSLGISAAEYQKVRARVNQLA